MPVSGIVLTLLPDLEGRAAVLEAVSGDERVSVGDPVGGALPVVTETETMEEHEELWHRLAALPGVLQVRLAYHDFSDVDTCGRASARAPGRRRNGG